MSKMRMIQQKHSKLICSHYGPISLLSNIDKILKRIMNNRLYTFLKKTNFFQFSFRKKYSTKHALIYLTELIKKQMDDGNYGCGIFIDFHNALSGS